MRLNQYQLLAITALLISSIWMAWTLPNPGNWRSKVAPEVLESAMANGQADFLLILNQQADVSAAQGTKSERGWSVFNQLQNTAQASQASLIDLLEQRHIRYRTFYIINSIQVIGDYDLIRTLAERDEVAKIQHNPAVKLDYLKEEDGSASQRTLGAIEWGITMIRADQVWDLGYRGQGVVVGGADTGFEWTHPSLQSKYRGYSETETDHNYNWHDAIHSLHPIHEDPDDNPMHNPCGLSVLVPCDDNNHGTHTMGTMVGEAADNQIGVAPAASWIACRNMERGYGTLASYIECFEWFLAPTDLNNENPNPELAPHVINNSWYCPEIEGCNVDNWGTMETIVNNLRASGVVVVVSAGNDGNQGCSTIASPASIFDKSFTIGSTTSEDSISSFSSRGPVTSDGSMRTKPNVTAPGSQVRSAVREGEYATFSGTSMAGPHVAGLVALLISAVPDLAGQVEQIETIIEQTAVPKTTDENCGSILGTSIPNNTYGYGRVDALAAINLALQASSVTNTNSGITIRPFPNPVTEVVQFELINLRGQLQVELFNAAGQRLRQTQFNIQDDYQVESFSLADLPLGLYVYKITSEAGGSYSGKLLKD